MKFALFLLSVGIFDAVMGAWLFTHRPDAVFAWGPPIACGVFAGLVGALNIWVGSREQDRPALSGESNAV